MTNRRNHFAIFVLAAGWLISGCSKGAPPASLLDSGVVAPANTGGEPTASAAGSASATSALVAPGDAGSPAGAVDDVQVRGKKLFDAIVRDEPDIALKEIFFPRDAFLALKDVKDPSAYYDKLAKDFKAHVHYFHKKLGKKAAEAEFEVLEMNTKSQVYIAPKKEMNKSGYNKITRSKLKYKLKGKSRAFEIAVMIDSDARFFVTHLRK